MDKYYIILQNSYGKFILIENDKGQISGVHSGFVDVKNLVNKPTENLIKLKEQLEQYFAGKRKTFSVPFSQRLTPFQKEVYDILLNIPYGYTVTYGDIAYLMGKEKASRAVGNALGKNNLLILVPCHRVLAKSSLGGFSSGLDLKKALLKLEKSWENES